jgi:uncharacterized membrane protein YhaH (DUF805 family)
METVVKFGTKDRYFSDKNEKRIRRVGFLLRMIAIFIMTALLSLAINMLLVNFIGLRLVFVWPVIMIALSVLLMFSYPALVKKRSHDFNSDGKIASYIVLGSLASNFVLNCYTLYTFYTGSFANLIQPNMFMQILNYVLMWASIASLIVFIILIFRPGTVGANNYWEFLK